MMWEMSRRAEEERKENAETGRGPGDWKAKMSGVPVQEIAVERQALFPRFFPDGTVWQKYYRVRWRKRSPRRSRFRPRNGPHPAPRHGSCGRNRTSCRRECRPRPGARNRPRRRLAHAVPAHLRHLVAAAVGLGAACQVEADDPARDQAQAGRVALGAVVQQHLHAYADAEERLGRGGFQHALLQADSRSSRMQSGMAPCPAARCAGRRALPRGARVTATVQPVPAAAACTACETERRLPMP